AGERVDESEHGAAQGLHQLEQRVGIDAGRGDVAAQSIHREQPEREGQPLAQVRDREDVAEALDHSSVQLPPAASIFSRATRLNLSALTWSAPLTSPSPRIFTGLPRRARPRSRSTSGSMAG